MMWFTLGFDMTSRFTPEAARATSRTAGSSSTESTASMKPMAASHPVLLPVPSPMTMARGGSGCRMAPRSPRPTWVGASWCVLPSILPLITNARPSWRCRATLLSTPSTAQTISARRRRSLGEQAGNCRDDQSQGHHEGPPPGPADRQGPHRRRHLQQDDEFPAAESTQRGEQPEAAGQGSRDCARGVPRVGDAHVSAQRVSSLSQ